MDSNVFRISVRDMVFAAVFCALLCAVSPFSFAFGPVPLTFATLVIYLAAGTLRWKIAMLSVVLYILMGIIGLPVFTNFEGGFHKVAGVTGGFIIGYIPCAFATGFITEVFKKRIWSYILGMVIGTVLLYTCGTAWFAYQTGSSFAISLTLCVTPFLIGDSIKIALACIITPQLRNALAHVSRV